MKVMFLINLTMLVLITMVLMMKMWNHIADGTDVSSAIDASGNGIDDTKMFKYLKLFLKFKQN